MPNDPTICPPICPNSREYKPILIHLAMVTFLAEIQATLMFRKIITARRSHYPMEWGAL
jgi:hypothetical protein